MNPLEHDWDALDRRVQLTGLYVSQLPLEFLNQLVVSI